jgi:hypothetical protein
MFFLFFCSSSTDESTNITTTTTTTTTVNHPIDPRTETLKTHIELYNSFVQSLFTILYEVYNCSAGPAVKHRCLQSLLRMIYYSSSDLLESILKQHSISSHIASMLASPDYKIVISALQISEILMKKLPDIFSVYFYREGVVHQIEILIGFGISSSSHLSLLRSQHSIASQSQVDLVHTNENSLTPTIPTLSESLGKMKRNYFSIFNFIFLDEQQIHQPPPPPPPSTHRGAAAQLHPKTQSFPYRTTTSRRYQTESTSTGSSTTTKIETRSQRAPPPSSSSRIKSSTRSMFDDMTSTTATPPSDTSSMPLGRGRSSYSRATTFDPSSFTSNRPRPSTPIYVPSSYLQQTPYASASSAPAAASLLMSTSMPTQVTQQRQSHVTLSSQERAKIKEWIQNQSRNFRTNYFLNNSSTSNIALQIINRLAAAVDILHVGKDHIENTKALCDIANIIAKGDVSPFEMVHSGLITKLYQYLTDDLSIPNNRSDRVKQFLNIFMNIPLEKNENIEDDETILKQYIIDLHNTQLNHGKTHHRNEQNVLSHLINKLHGCINQLEQFPIRGEIYNA